ncbi:MAG: hypothetical protein MK074_05580 [Phycisphaerales bacterium]|nr:hypothetical protein [Phycisphaerales bacterium]
MVTDGTGLSSNAHYCTSTLTRLDEYPGGDWASNAPLRARLIFAHDQTGLSELQFRSLRGDSAGPYVSFSPNDASDRAWIDWVDAHVPMGTGEVTTQVRTPAAWLSTAQGGPFPCPENCTEGSTFYHVGQVIWRTDVPGLQVDSIAEGGFTVEHHLTEAGHYDDEALQRYLLATRQPNCFMILLGQNMSWAQMQDIEGLWRSHVTQLIDRYRSAALAVDADANPLFLLVAPWSTNDDSDRHHRIALVLADIAMQTADVGLVNLHLAAGAHAYLQGTVLPDGVHYGDDASANLLAGLVWEQLQRELDQKTDLVVQGDPQDLSTLTLEDGDILHLASGMHTGPLTIDSIQASVRGWSNDASGIAGNDAGPAIRIQNNANVDIRRLQMHGGAGHTEGDGLLAGGCIYGSDSALQLRHVDMQGSPVARGGVLALRDCHATLADSECALGTAAETGGLVDLLSSTLEVTQTTLQDGLSSHGGGLYAQTSQITAVDVTLRNCTAQVGGGAALVTSTSHWVGCRVLNNTAEAGGGMHAYQCAAELSLTTVCGNSPDDINGEWIDSGGNSVGGNCSCPTDFDGDGQTDVVDLLILLSNWGNGGGEGDVDDNGDVDVFDLLNVIAAWGPCG